MTKMVRVMMVAVLAATLTASAGCMGSESGEDGGGTGIGGTGIGGTGTGGTGTGGRTGTGGTGGTTVKPVLPAVSGSFQVVTTIDLTVNAMELAPRLDHAVLFSGDGDFRPLVEALQRQAVRVSVVSTMRSQPPMIADELRRQADNFIELDALREVIGRPPREGREPGSMTTDG